MELRKQNTDYKSGYYLLHSMPYGTWSATWDPLLGFSEVDASTYRDEAVINRPGHL